jgi:hypothetical protein
MFPAAYGAAESDHLHQQRLGLHLQELDGSYSSAEYWRHQATLPGEPFECSPADYIEVAESIECGMFRDEWL